MSYTFYVFLYCLVLFFFMLFKGGKRKYEVYLLLVLPVLIYVHSFLDPNTIADLPTYRESFADVRLTNVFNPVDLQIYRSFHKEEFGFILLLKLVGLFTDDFNVFLCLFSGLLLGVYSYVILKLSPNVCLSILFLMVIVFDQSIFVLRQHLSVAFILLTIPSIIERKIWKFTAILTIAILFHKSSLIWGIMYFMYGIKKPWKMFVTLGLVAIGLGLIFSFLSFFDEQLSLGYSSYIDGKKTGKSNLVSFFIGLGLFLSYFFICRKKVFENGLMKVCLLSLYVYVVLSLVGINIGLLSRFTLVFQTSLFFVIPIVCKVLKNKWLKVGYVSSCLICFAYINYFGSFSEYLANTKLFVFGTEQMLYYLVFTGITLYSVIFLYERHLMADKKKRLIRKKELSTTPSRKNKMYV
jgi:type III secretory pathway component EscS